MERIRVYFLSAGIAALLAVGTAAAQTSTGENPDMSAPAQTSTAAPHARAAGSRSSLTVPTGTEIAVRTNEAIDSTNARAGQKFSGTVEENVTGPNGEVLIPKGSNAELVIRNVSSGGTTSSPELALDLHSIDIGGHPYVVSSRTLQQQSGKEGIGKNKRTGEYVGGGAALGAVIGAVAGGGKGAVLGGLAGAAAGGAAQVLTKGKEVKVPAESTLKFRLDKPLHLRSASRTSY